MGAEWGQFAPLGRQQALVTRASRGPVYACIKLAGARGSRTHRPVRRAGANGFEVREAHQDPFAPGTPTLMPGRPAPRLVALGPLGYGLFQPLLEHRLRYGAYHLTNGLASVEDQ